MNFPEEIFDAHDEDRSGRLSFEEITRVIETLMATRQVALGSSLWLWLT